MTFKQKAPDVSTAPARIDVNQGEAHSQDTALCKRALEVTGKLGEEIPHRFPEKRAFTGDFEENGVSLRLEVRTDTWVGEELPNVSIGLYRLNKGTTEWEQISHKNPGYDSSKDWNPELAVAYLDRIYGAMENKE